VAPARACECTKPAAQPASCIRRAFFKRKCKTLFIHSADFTNALQLHRFCATAVSREKCPQQSSPPYRSAKPFFWLPLRSPRLLMSRLS
jgi:hypothetical protein